MRRRGRRPARRRAGRGVVAIIAISLMLLSLGSVCLMGGAVWSVFWLFAQADDLRDEIEDLKRQREPLILKTSLGHFFCTGSMEPTFSCLDSATFLLEPRMEDIVVGTTVSFIGAAPAAHRVIDIKLEDGVRYFLTKGDAAQIPDGWVPETDVDGYVTELHRNTHLQNLALREGVNQSRADVDAAWQKVESAWGTPSYEQRVAEYEALAEVAECWKKEAIHAIYSDHAPPIYVPCR